MKGFKKWSVVLAGFGINLAFGVLYTWSIFSTKLQDALAWSNTESSLPYTVAIIMFAVMMIPAGKLQDKIGPRLVATLGGILIGSGCILSGYLQSLTGIVFSFGILAGSGIGLGYASTTPAAVKWFPKEMKGVISGIVVSGFGLASLYIVPLSKYLLANYSVFDAFKILGVIFLLMTIPMAQFIQNPPDTLQTKKVGSQTSIKSVIHTKQFVILWIMFLIGSTAGLMTIGGLKSIVKGSLGENAALNLIAFSAIANALGRPIAGYISETLGRGKTMAIFFLLEGISLFVFYSLNVPLLIFTSVCIVYFAYGAMLSIFPSACSDYFGTNDLGRNYGVLFSAWGVGGIMGPLLGSRLADITGSYHLSFTIAASLLVVGAILGFLLKPEKLKSLVVD